MYTAISLICLTLLFSAGKMLNLFVKDSNNFGPYDSNLVHYELCKGPKSRNTTLVLTNLTDMFGYFHFTFLEEVKIDEVKITVYSMKNNIKSLLWTYKMTDPCSHFAFGGIISVVFKSHNCVVDKGSYSTSLNFKDVASEFLGTSFFYGDFMLKSIVTSKKGNILCVITINRFSKKTKNNLQA